jgi:hypothetical protein
LQTFYTPGDYIIRQGARGDTFFIISKGQVSAGTVTQVVPLQFDLVHYNETLPCVSGESDNKTAQH